MARARVLLPVPLAALLLVLLPATAARADWLFTPFVGSTFKTATTFTLPDANADRDKKTFVGGSVALLSDKVFGVEGEIAYAGDFFQHGAITATTASHVATFTLNAMVTLPLAVTRDSLRPYLVGGYGAIQSRAETARGILDIDDTSAGFAIGGGAIGMLSRRSGVRFDLRRFRTAGRSPSLVTGVEGPRLAFWRASIGVIIRH